MTIGHQRAARAAEPFLQPGETVHAVGRASPRGSLWGAPLAGVLGSLVLPRLYRHERRVAAAAGLPLRWVMTLVVTDRRLLVLDGRRMLGQLQAQAVAGAEVVKRRRSANWTVALDLAGGGRVHLEASRAYDPERLVAALTALASGGR